MSLHTTIVMTGELGEPHNRVTALFWSRYSSGERGGEMDVATASPHWHARPSGQSAVLLQLLQRPEPLKYLSLEKRVSVSGRGINSIVSLNKYIIVELVYLYYHSTNQVLIVPCPGVAAAVCQAERGGRGGGGGGAAGGGGGCETGG